MKISKMKTTKFYQKVVIAFFVLTIVVLALILYFSLSKTVISVTLRPANFSFDFYLKLKNELTEQDKKNPEIIQGVIVEKELSGSKTTQDLLALKEVADHATGEVTIYNNWTKVQPLAATTRLLSSEGVLFRTKERVDVPAGGKVKAEVYADQPGEQGNIGPTTFEIVALWPGLKEKIYAVSYEPMQGGLQKIKIVTQKDIDNLKQVLTEELKIEAQSKLEALLQEKGINVTLNPEDLTAKVISESHSAEADEEAEELTVNLTLRVSGIIFNPGNLTRIIKERLLKELPSDQKIINGSLRYSYLIENSDLHNQEANIKIQVQSQTLPKLSSPIFNRDNFVGRTKKEIRNYLLNFEQVRKVEVRFSPFWMKKAPTFKNQIKIRLLTNK